MLNKTIYHVNMQHLATFVILLVMSPVLLILGAVVVGFDREKLEQLLGLTG